MNVAIKFETLNLILFVIENKYFKLKSEKECIDREIKL